MSDKIIDEVMGLVKTLRSKCEAIGREERMADYLKAADMEEAIRAKLREVLERKPLTDDQIETIAIDVLGYGALSEPDLALFTQSVRATERAHNIGAE